MTAQEFIALCGESRALREPLLVARIAALALRARSFELAQNWHTMVPAADQKEINGLRDEFERKCSELAQVAIVFDIVMPKLTVDELCNTHGKTAVGGRKIKNP